MDSKTNEVIKIKRIAFKKGLLIRGVEAGDGFFVMIVRLSESLFWGDEGVFEAGNSTEDGAWLELIGIDIECFGGSFDETLLFLIIENGKSGCIADGRNFLTKKERADVVEGADIRESRSGGKLIEEMDEALLHFLRGFIGESDSEDVFGRDMLMVNEPCDTMGEGFGLAAASSREDEYWPLGGFDCAELFGI